MRRQLSEELGLELKQIKFWFQNRRTQAKAQADRTLNCSLRRENEKIIAENLMFRETLKNLVCVNYGRPALPDDAAQHRMEQLILQNKFLKEQHKKMAEFLASYNVIGPSRVSSSHCYSHNQELSSMLSSGSSSITTINNPSPTTTRIAIPTSFLDPHIQSSLCQNTTTRTLIGIRFFMEEEIIRMREAASKAMDELSRLLRMNEPFWYRSTVNSSFILHRQTYDSVFHRVGLRCGARREASKDSRLVAMNGFKLVDMFLDSEKWVSLFPTIVKRAKTMEVLNTGLPQTRSGALQLMYGEIHTLSPMIRPREFFFLRYCVQVDVGVWIISDVSFDSSRFTNSLTWKLPSGCLIQDMNNGYSTVTWLEHVEISDDIQTHPIFRDVVSGNYYAFGAERWILTLERMCERIVFASMDMMPSCDIGIIALPEGRKNVMKLSQRMVKVFCRYLDMSGNMELQCGEYHRNGVRLGIRTSLEPGVPKGMIVTASTSIWLPILPQSLFNFLKDPTTRPMWDALCYANPVVQIQRISNGTFTDNFTTIIRRHDTLVLQECCTDSLGSMVVYAPVSVDTVTATINGEGTTEIPILPSGFTICGDGSPPRGPPPYYGCAPPPEARHYGGSVLTMAIQVLVCNQHEMGHPLNMNIVDAAYGLASTTLHNIKAAVISSS
ncbi:hypothetical protein PIB30_019190 [Stylosanthes scabra]|uniref:Uncharacterized protein n=1 Tax=Stylosanthes scabra TaxID=79078 RepID=A0ABU6Z5Q5_9FABA|nr:hypothetical protein [Stylosanthes scabra]